jgi:ADP-ribosyltransferase exoenzyme
MAVPEPSAWLSAYARVQRLADRDILKLLRQADRDIAGMLTEIQARSRGIGDIIRREQLLTVKRNLLREQAAIFSRLGDIVDVRRAEAAARAIAMGSAVDTAVLTAAGRTAQARALADALRSGMRQTLDTALARFAGESRIPLSERIYRTRLWMDGRLERKINSALLRGLSAREFAAEARDWFRPNTPGGVRYASLRLARTEINNAYHAVSVQQAIDKPWVEGMKWHLSGSHPRSDVCDSYAHGGRQGNGVFAPQDVPRKPHPQCLCFVTLEIPDEDEFLDNLVQGKYNDYLRQSTGRMQPPPTIQRSIPSPPLPRRGSVAKELPAQTAAKNGRGLEQVVAQDQLYDGFRAGEWFTKASPTPVDLIPEVREYFAKSDRINLALRSGEPLSNEMQRVVAAVDHAMGLTTTSQPLVTYRGVSSELLGSGKTGDLFTDPAYWSTTMDINQAKKFARSADSVILHLEIPQGTHVIAENATELEVLLQRGSKFRIIGRDGDDVFAVMAI